MVRLVLFDIDGTLIRTGGAGVKAFERTFASVFDLPEANGHKRVEELLTRFGLESTADTLAESLPLGIRQRLSLAVADGYLQSGCLSCGGSLSLSPRRQNCELEHGEGCKQNGERSGSVCG